MEKESLAKKNKKLEEELKTLHDSYTKQIENKNNEINKYKNDILTLKKTYENEKAERDRKEKEKEKERERERERIERERIEKEKKERERIEKEKERERIEKEKERERIEKEERERIEKEKIKKQKEKEERERIANLPYEGKFDKNEYKIEKNKSELNDNANIEWKFKIKNISKEKKWKKGFSIKIKNYNHDEIHILDGNTIDNELNPGIPLNKTITFFIDNIEKNYLLDIYLYDDDDNIINNCSTKLNIIIKNDEKNKLKFEITDDDIEEIFKSLCEEYTVENLGVNVDTIKKDIKEYSKINTESNTKEEFIEGFKTYIMDKMF